MYWALLLDWAFSTAATALFFGVMACASLSASLCTHPCHRKVRFHEQWHVFPQFIEGKQETFDQELSLWPDNSGTYDAWCR